MQHDNSSSKHCLILTNIHDTSRGFKHFFQYLKEALCRIESHENIDDIKAVVSEPALADSSNQCTQSLKGKRLTSHQINVSIHSL